MGGRIVSLLQTIFRRGLTASPHLQNVGQKSNVTETRIMRLVPQIHTVDEVVLGGGRWRIIISSKVFKVQFSLILLSSTPALSPSPVCQLFLKWVQPPPPRFLSVCPYLLCDACIFVPCPIPCPLFTCFPLLHCCYASLTRTCHSALSWESISWNDFVFFKSEDGSGRNNSLSVHCASQIFKLTGASAWM